MESDELERIYENIDILPDKVIDLETERTFTFKAEILNLHSNLLDFSHARIGWENPIPIFDENGGLIGHASIYRVVGPRILADISIIYSCAERLDIESKSKKLYFSLPKTFKIELCLYECLGNDMDVLPTPTFPIIDKLILSTYCPDNTLTPAGDPIIYDNFT